jgi:hypothetical protein
LQPIQPGAFPTRFEDFVLNPSTAARTVERSVPRLLRQASLAAFGSFAFRKTDPLAILDEAARADESSPQGRAFITDEPLIYHDVEGNNSFVLPAFYGEHKIVSTVDVIVASRKGSPFGILEIDSVTPPYDEHDADFLTGFANILAEAVATAPCAEVLRQTVARTRVLVAAKYVLRQELQHPIHNNLQLVNGVPGKAGLRGILRRIATLSNIYDPATRCRAEAARSISRNTRGCCPTACPSSPETSASGSG